MSIDSFYAAKPADIIFYFVTNLAFTLIIYGAFPLIFSRVRSEPITKKAYKTVCYIFNFVVMVLVNLANGSYAWTLPPYILWTSVFSNSGYKKLEKRGLLEDDGNSAEAISSGETSNIAPERKFLCKNCGTYSTGWYQTCPACGAKGQMVKAAAPISGSSSQDDERRKIFYCVKCGFIGSDYESKNNSCPKCASRLVKTDISRRQWLSMSETQKQNMKDQWHGGKTGPQNVQENKKSYDEVRFCRICGSQLLPGAAFCSNCGAKVDIMPVKQNQRVIENLPEVKQLDEVQSSASYEPTGKHEGSYTSSSNKVRSSQTGEDTPKNYDIDSILKEFL